MAHRTDQCGGETSSAGMVNEHGSLTLAVRLPCGCLVGNRRPIFSAYGSKYSPLAASMNLESASLMRRFIVCDFALVGVSVDKLCQSEYRDMRIVQGV